MQAGSLARVAGYTIAGRSRLREGTLPCDRCHRGRIEGTCGPPSPVSHTSSSASATSTPAWRGIAAPASWQGLGVTERPGGSVDVNHRHWHKSFRFALATSRQVTPRADLL